MGDGFPERTCRFASTISGVTALPASPAVSKPVPTPSWSRCAVSLRQVRWVLVAWCLVWLVSWVSPWLRPVQTAEVCSATGFHAQAWTGEGWETQAKGSSIDCPACLPWGQLLPLLPLSVVLGVFQAAAPDGPRWVGVRQRLLPLWPGSRGPPWSGFVRPARPHSHFA